MMTHACDRALPNNRHTQQVDLRARERIDLPAALVMYDDNLIDHVFDVVFERLGRCVIELRIHAEAGRARPHA